jgi:hypothetical protein
MIVIMEVSWITPWFRSLTPETYAVSPRRIMLILTIMVLFSHYIVRVMNYLRLKKSIRQGIMLAILIICSFIGIKMLLYVHESISVLELINRPMRSFTNLKYLIPAEFFVVVAVLIGFWRVCHLPNNQLVHR